MLSLLYTNRNRNWNVLLCTASARAPPACRLIFGCLFLLARSNMLSKVR